MKERPVFGESCIKKWVIHVLTVNIQSRADIEVASIGDFATTDDATYK